MGLVDDQNRGSSLFLLLEKHVVESRQTCRFAVGRTGHVEFRYQCFEKFLTAEYRVQHERRCQRSVIGVQPGKNLHRCMQQRRLACPYLTVDYYKSLSPDDGLHDRLKSDPV